MQISRHALHAIALKIKVNNERKVFMAPMPKDFTHWISKNFKTHNLEEKIKQLIERKLYE